MGPRPQPTHPIVLTDWGGHIVQLEPVRLRPRNIVEIIEGVNLKGHSSVLPAAILSPLRE